MMTDRPAEMSGLRTPADVMAQLTIARSNGDVELATACYEPEATIVAELGRIVSGREATHTFIAAATALPLVITARSIVQGDGVALHQAAWTVAQPDGMTLSGCTADVLRQQADGSWLIALDNPWGSAIV